MHESSPPLVHAVAGRQLPGSTGLPAGPAVMPRESVHSFPSAFRSPAKATLHSPQSAGTVNGGSPLVVAGTPTPDRGSGRLRSLTYPQPQHLRQHIRSPLQQPTHSPNFPVSLTTFICLKLQLAVFAKLHDCSLSMWSPPHGARQQCGLQEYAGVGDGRAGSPSRTARRPAAEGAVLQQRGCGSPDSASSGTQHDLDGFHVVCRICERVASPCHLSLQQHCHLQ